VFFNTTHLMIQEHGLRSDDFDLDVVVVGTWLLCGFLVSHSTGCILLATSIESGMLRESSV
jgi:hypothetical protein